MILKNNFQFLEGIFFRLDLKNGALIVKFVKQASSSPQYWGGKSGQHRVPYFLIGSLFLKEIVQQKIYRL